MPRKSAKQQRVSVVHPHTRVVKISPRTDFVYIMRKDGQFTTAPIARRLANDLCLDEANTRQVLAEEYDRFVAILIGLLGECFASRGRSEIHLYDPLRLERIIRAKAGADPLVSLDPLLSEGVYTLPVSRGYHLSGRTDFGQVARPGHGHLVSAARAIAGLLHDRPVCVVEDDIFSGSSLIASLLLLIEHGVAIKKIIPGLQIGSPSRVSELGIPVDPAVRYCVTDDSDIFTRVDLGDPRDYLIGASGLVVRLPDGRYGRAPYILPFVSASARASVPAELEGVFSHHVLCANLDFFQRVGERLGRPIVVKYLDPHFVTLMHGVYGIHANTPMDRVARWALHDLDRIWAKTQTLGEWTLQNEPDAAVVAS